MVDDIDIISLTHCMGKVEPCLNVEVAANKIASEISIHDETGELLRKPLFEVVRSLPLHQYVQIEYKLQKCQTTTGKR